RACEENTSQRGEEQQYDTILEGGYIGGGCGVRCIDFCNCGAQPCRILGELDSLAAGNEEAQKGEHRDEQSTGKEQRLYPAVDRLQPKPEPQADAAVDPGDDECG